MPLDKYYKGEGQKVMRSMKKQYGDKKGKSVFYATANKQDQNPSPPGIKERKPETRKRGIKRG